MLCSNADGVPLTPECMKMAVPGTRAVELRALLAKMSSGRLTSAMRARIRRRPLDQVVSRMKATAPTSRGNQPPLGILVALARKYAPFTMKNSAATGTQTYGFHFHTATSSTANRQVSISIAPVTAMP